VLWHCRAGKQLATRFRYCSSLGRLTFARIPGNIQLSIYKAGESSLCQSHTSCRQTSHQRGFLCNAQGVLDLFLSLNSQCSSRVLSQCKFTAGCAKAKCLHKCQHILLCIILCSECLPGNKHTQLLTLHDIDTLHNSYMPIHWVESLWSLCTESRLQLPF